MRKRIAGLLLAAGILPFVFGTSEVSATVLPQDRIATTSMSEATMKSELKDLMTDIGGFTGARYSVQASFKAPYHGSVMSPEYLDLVKRNLNFFRKLAGSPEIKTMTSSQDIANVALVQGLMHRAGGPRISHFPVQSGFQKPDGMSEEFYDKYARNAVDYHNILSYGHEPAMAVIGYLNEGLTNFTLGHRNSLIAPTVTGMDFGGLTDGSAEYTAGKSEVEGNLPDKDLFAFPGPGAFPATVMRAKGFAWGFYFNPETIEVTPQLTITVEKEGEPASVHTGITESYDQGTPRKIFRYDSWPYDWNGSIYGIQPPFEQKGYYAPGTYHVFINGLKKNGEPAEFSYTVKLVDVADSMMLAAGPYDVYWHGSDGNWRISYGRKYLRNIRYYVGDKVYLIGKDGRVAQNSWEYDRGGYFWYNNDCQEETGWVDAEGKRWYVDPERGRLAGMQRIGEDTYWLNHSGGYHKGRLNYRGQTYYFNEEGKMQIHWFTDGEKRCYADGKGRMVNGLRFVGKKLYYFGPKDNPYVRTWSGFRKIGDAYYYSDQDGSLRRGWVTVNGKKYYMDGKGRRVSGVRFVGKTLYAFGGPEDGSLQKFRGFRKIGSEYYYGNGDGGLHRGWFHRGDKTYRLDGKGRRMHGFRYVDGKLYFFGGKSDGSMRKLNGFRKIGEDYYHYDKDHSLHRGWLTRKDGKYYMDGKGRRASGYRKIGNKTYYFGKKTDGRLQTPPRR